MKAASFTLAAWKAWSCDNERSAAGSLEKGVLVPPIPLTCVVTVDANEDDKRPVPKIVLVECIENVSQLCIHKTRSCDLAIRLVVISAIGRTPRAPIQCPIRDVATLEQCFASLRGLEGLHVFTGPRRNITRSSVQRMNYLPLKKNYRKILCVIGASFGFMWFLTTALKNSRLAWERERIRRSNAKKTK